MALNPKQRVILLSFESYEEVNASTFTDYVSEKFNLEISLLNIDFPKTHFPFHHTYPFEFYKKTAILIEEKLTALITKHDCVMVTFGYDRKNSIQKNYLSDILMACRNLRIPYIGIPEDGIQFSSISKMALPIGFLVEEKEKAPLSNIFSACCNSDIVLIQPQDRGTRAEKNVSFIQKILKNYGRNPQLIKGKKPSSKIEFEAIEKAKEHNFDIVFISASREYSLDDIFFRPKELHVLWKSEIPVLIVNPRDDLYVLCGS